MIRSAADSKYGCYSSILLPLASLGSAAGARGNGSGTAAAPLRCNRALNATRPFDFNASQRAITTLAPDRDLFAEILESEEEHVDFLETQFDLIKQMGIQNYVQMQSKPVEG